MSNVEMQIRADTAANLAAATPALAEFGMDTTRSRIVIGDGSTLGGIPHAKLTDAQGYGFIANCAIGAAIASNNLTLSLLNAAGNNPSAANAIFAPFRTAPASTSSEKPVFAEITSALSVTINNGDTLGTANNVAFRIWVVLYDNGGTPALGVINCLNGTGITPLDESMLVSPTATIGNSAGVFYSGASVAAGSPFRIIGYAEYGLGLATAGTWNALPTKMQLFGPGVHKPGDVVQDTGPVTLSTGASTTNTCTIGSSAPTTAQGISGGSVSITPTSAANLLDVAGQAALSNSGTNNYLVGYLYNGTSVVAMGLEYYLTGYGGYPIPVPVGYAQRAGQTTAITWTIYGTSNGNTTYINESNSSAAVFGAVSKLRIREIMA